MAPKRWRSSVTIVPAPGSAMEPKRRGRPPAAFGAGMTSGPPALLAAAWLLETPRSAMLTVAQPRTAAAAVIRARSVSAHLVLIGRRPARGRVAGRAGALTGMGQGKAWLIRPEVLGSSCRPGRIASAGR